METLPFWLPLLFFLIATFYATVGFGGGSSYLAVLALIGLPYTTIPQTALVCNLVVSGGGVWHFHRGRHLEWRRVLPLVALSVPMAYLGGRIPIGKQVFLLLLGVSLFVAGTRMFLPLKRRGLLSSTSTRAVWLVGLPLGAALGFLAGIVGIGGGIFLAPLLILTGWGDARATAAASSVFILVNSAAGLTGQLAKGVYLDAMILPLVLAVFLGGQIGSRLGSYQLGVVRVQRLIGALILLVSVRVLLGAA
jgi:uncharacterized membrane protein YfcA